MKKLLMPLLVFTFVQANNTACLFCHGVIDNGYQAKRYTGISLGIPYHTFDFPDACKRYAGDFWRLFKSSFAQESELIVLEKEYNALCAEYPERDIIGVGLSRGASLWVNFVASKRQNKLPKALILESPYDSMKTIIPHKVKRILPDDYISENWQNRIKKIAHMLLGFGFVNYNRNGIQPIKSINDAPKELPILLICSKEDTNVNWQSTKMLYVGLIQAGHKEVHLVVLEKGKHANLIHDAQCTKFGRRSRFF